MGACPLERNLRPTQAKHAAGAGTASRPGGLYAAPAEGEAGAGCLYGGLHSKRGRARPVQKVLSRLRAMILCCTLVGSRSVAGSPLPGFQEGAPLLQCLHVQAFLGFS